MNLKLTLVCVLLMMLAIQDLVQAEFLFNRAYPTKDMIRQLGLKCIPGRTVIKMQSKPIELKHHQAESSDEEDRRRSHMRFQTNEEYCQVCVCSVEGKDEYCSNRPAMNVNECMMLGNVMEQFKKNEPYDHERSLSYRIRRVGDGTADAKCTPFVSMYTDCTEENKCDGCNKCSCSAEAKWVCETFSDCAKKPSLTEEGHEDEEITDRNAIDSALDWMIVEMKEEEKTRNKNRYVPDPEPPESQIDPLIDVDEKIKTVSGSEQVKEEDELLSYFREKRSVRKENINEKKGNRTVIFHHTVDEVNEDTLKNTNETGTLQASKFDPIPLASRRSTLLNNLTSTALQIEYTPPINNQHAADNKVDTSAIHDDQLDLLVHHKLYEMVGNKSQVIRDKDLSKIVVNELKGDVSEIIGDKNSPVISNITFTSENDTITAIAFIAGNLLNKLWNMEKDTSDSLETENMKHKKINELLELFKEPLNLRQETFLKNALEHLSKAIEKKDIENVSLCQNIEELKKTEGLITEPPAGSQNERNNVKPDINPPKFNHKTATADALYKINNILDLLKKYEMVKNNLSDYKSNKKSAVRTYSAKNLTKDETTTLNVFGNVLESLTKWLLPHRRSKKLIKAIRNKNVYSSDRTVQDRLQNLNLINLTLTDKDKIVLDYLTHIQNNPGCLYNKRQENLTLPNIEGDILLNISDFFKIQSVSDLLNLLGLENKKKELIAHFAPSMTEIPLTESYETTNIDKEITDNENLPQFETTKKKLISHLKTILEDLVELQNITGKTTKGRKMEIADALPCIYNLINFNKNINKTIQSKKQSNLKKLNEGSEDPVNHITEILNNLKKELKNTSQTRRNNGIIGLRSKSAVVWERTIKNINSKHKLQTRKNFEGNPRLQKAIEDMKKMIEKLESSGSNTYKSFAYLVEVPAAERLLLLKTLAVDTKNYISILTNIKSSLEGIKTLSKDKFDIISEFIDNANININLNEKILSNLDKPKKDLYLSNREKKPKKLVKVYESASDLEMTESSDNVIKLSRDQILNQLIKNRMQYYLRMKDTSVNKKDNMIKDLAKKVLLYLEIGNDNLARELYKTLIAQNKKKSTNKYSSYVTDPVKYTAFNQHRTEKKPLNKFPVPLIQFEEPKLMINERSWSNPDQQLIKQLMNIKHMKI